MEIKANGNLEKNTPCWKVKFNPDILFLILDKSAYLLVLGWKEKLSQNYLTICNLEIKKIKNILKNINYYSPQLVIMVGKNELETGKILIKDCQRKQEFSADKEELVSWIYSYL